MVNALEKFAMFNTQHHARGQAGISLLEQLIGLAVAAVVASAAVPGMADMKQRTQMQAAAQLLRSDLFHARSLAIAQGESVRMHLQEDAAGSCYVVHTGATRSCTCSTSGGTSCSGNAVALRHQVLAATTGVSMRLNSSSMTFDSGLGTVTPTGTFQLSTRQGQTLRVVVNIMGRVRFCTPTPPMSQVPVC